MANISLNEDPQGGVTPAPRQPVPARQVAQLTTQAPAVDSLAWANNILDRAAPRTGKKWDTANIKESAQFNRVVAPAVTHLYEHISKYKPEIDAAYAEKVKENPDFKGFTAKELDKYTNNEGSKYMGYLDAYDKYRNMTKIKEEPVNKLSIGPSSFGGSNKSTVIPLYTPDRGASTIKIVR